MAALFALASAGLFGTGDFCGGLAAKSTPARQVVLWSHVIGLVGVAGLAPLLADAFSASDFLLGGLGGLAGMLGVLLLYRNLALGPMAIVAPLTAVASAMVPLLWDLADGASLSRLAAIGVVTGLIAIVLVSIEPDATEGAAITVRTVAESLLSGAGFGTFFVLLDATESASAPWPVVGARVASTLAMALVVFGAGAFRSPPKAAWGVIALAGLCDVGGNIAFLLATNRGQLAVVAVLAALYPAITAVLANVVLDERIARIQLVGFVLALASVVLVGVS